MTATRVAGKVDSKGLHALPAAGHPRQTPSGIPMMPSCAVPNHPIQLLLLVPIPLLLGVVRWLTTACEGPRRI